MRDMLVKEIQHRRDLRAKVLLVDYSEALLDGLESSLPDRTPDIPDVIEPGRPAVPVVGPITSDESVLVKMPDGSWQPRLLVRLIPQTGIGISVGSIESQRRKLGSGEGWTVQHHDGQELQLSLMPVEEGVTYEVKLRAVGADPDRPGLASEWTATYRHRVIGKTTPPPTPVSASVSEGKLTWAMPSTPRDLAGFEIRSQSGVNRYWETAVPAHAAGLVSAPPFDVRGLGADLRTILIKAVDTGGNKSSGTASVVVDLANLRQGNIVEQIDFAAFGLAGQCCRWRRGGRRPGRRGSR